MRSLPGGLLNHPEQVEQDMFPWDVVHLLNSMQGWLLICDIWELQFHAVLSSCSVISSASLPCCLLLCMLLLLFLLLTVSPHLRSSCPGGIVMLTCPLPLLLLLAGRRHITLPLKITAHCWQPEPPWPPCALSSSFT